MKAVYVGILAEGTTSRMRAEWLRALTPGWEWTWVDTDGPMRGSARVWRTAAFRCGWGPVVEGINRLVESGVGGGPYDLGWVDKGVFLRERTLGELRRSVGVLVHFTPDTAFHANRSRFFERGMGMYDLLVTTKTFEVGMYAARVGVAKVFLTTQAYDPRVHFPRGGERRREVVFVGLCEPERAACVERLLGAGVAVRVAGRGWERVARRWAGSSLWRHEGEGLFGEAYGRVLSGAWVGLGSMSKRFPELHTTRTFEIPASGAVLATERSEETGRFFGEDEVLFYRDHRELVERVGELFERPEVMERLAARGMARVRRDGRDYPAVLRGVLRRAGVEPEALEAGVW